MKSISDTMRLPIFTREFTTRGMIRLRMALCEKCRNLIIWDKADRIVALYIPPTITDKKKAKGLC